MQLYLRDALPSDVDDLIGLLGNGHGSYDGPAHVVDYLDALREIDRRDDAYVMVADLGGRVVGMLQLFTFRHLQHRGGRCAEIESVRIADDYRDRGVDSRLVDHAVRRAIELGCYRIQVTTQDGRVDAHRLYEQHRFRPTHRGYKRYLESA